MSNGKLYEETPAGFFDDPKNYDLNAYAEHMKSRGLDRALNAQAGDMQGGKVVYYDSKLAEPKANEQQVGGNHYACLPIQPWDYITANKLGYLEGNVVKYVTRHAEKGGLDDLLKASHYLQKLIELHPDRQWPPGADEAK